MAKSNRQWAQDKIKASVNSCNSAVAHLEPIIETYNDPHPDIAQMLTMAQVVIVETRDMISKIGQSF